MSSRKQLELEQINIYTYSTLQRYRNYFKYKIEKNFLGTKNQKITNTYYLYNKKDILSYVLSIVSEIIKDKVNMDYVFASLDKIENYNEVLDKIALLVVQCELSSLKPKNSLLPKDSQRNRPGFTSVDGDDYYIKIKSSSLGVRFGKIDGKLLISGPTGAENKYSLIKKETFMWSISKKML